MRRTLELVEGTLEEGGSYGKDLDLREKIRDMEREVMREFPGHAVRWAFTDKTVIERIQKERIEEAVEKTEAMP